MHEKRIGDCWNEGKREATRGTYKGEGGRAGAGAFEDGVLLAVRGSGPDSRRAREIERCGAARCGNSGEVGTGPDRSGWARSGGGAESLLAAEQAARSCDDGGR